MKNGILRRFVLPALLLSAATAAWAEPPSRIWRVCVTDTAVPPYLHNDANRPGLLERLLADAGRQVGFSVLLLRYPVRRCRLLMEGDGADAVLAAATPANLAIFKFPMKAGAVDPARRLVRLNLVWVKREDSPYQWDGSVMQGGGPHGSLLVGTRAGMMAVNEPLLAKGFKVDSTAASAQQVLGKLAAKRLDLAVVLQEEVELVMSEQKAAALVVLPHALSSGDFYAPVRRDLSPELMEKVEAWWTLMSKLREQPQYLNR